MSESALLTNQELFGDGPAIPLNVEDLYVRSTRILIGDCRASLKKLPEKSVHMCVTSPPYWGLRDYKTEPQVWGGDPDHKHVWQERADKRSDKSCACGAWLGELGSEPSIKLYVEHMVEVFAEVHRVLRDDGTFWLNIGDTYMSSQLRGDNPKTIKDKDLCGIPWRLAFALQEWGWYNRAEIIWHKPAPIPESQRDRVGRSHEQIFQMSKLPRYWYDHIAVRKPSKANLDRPMKVFVSKYTASEDPKMATKKNLGNVRVEMRNLRSVWKIASSYFSGEHFAPYPPKLVVSPIKAGTCEHGVCAKCGAPYERVLEEIREPTREGFNSKYNKKNDADNPYSTHHGIVGNNDPLRHITFSRTLGWSPTCQCGVEKRIPATVLDPFLGSGTTGVVAGALGRRAIGCELNRHFAGLAKDRIQFGYTVEEQAEIDEPDEDDVPLLFDL